MPDQNDREKSREQLIAELDELRQQLADQAALRASSQQAAADYQQIKDHLPVLVGTAGLDGYYRAVNAAFERILGWSEQESLARPFLEFLHPEDRTAAIETFERLKSGQPAINFLDRNLCKDGSYRWINWTVILVPGQDFVFGVGQDVTSQRVAEEKLQQAHHQLEQRVAERTAELSQANEQLHEEIEQRRRSEEELAIFRQFVEAATQGFGMADLEGRIVYANSTLASLFGVHRIKDVLGTQLFRFCPDDYFKLREEEILPALLRGESWSGEVVMHFTDGRLHSMIHTVFPVHDDQGRLFCTATILTDITNLKRAEEACRESEQRMQMALDVSRSFTFEWNPATDHILRSDSCARVLGLSGDEVRHDTRQSFLQRVHLEDRDRFLRMLDDLQQTADTYHTEYRAMRGDDAVVVLEESGRGFFDSHGKLRRLVGVTTDITERKQAEEKLKAEQRALRRMVLAGDHERRLFTYELHDGVAQQLLGAMMLLESQQPRKGRESAARQNAYHDAMNALRHAAAEARRLMNRMRTPVLDRFGLTEAIEDVAAQLRLAPDAPEIECCYDVQFKRLEPTLENSLFRVAQEALVNACRHSQSAKVRVTLVQKNRDVTLEIRDWGLGFDQASVQENRFGLEGIRERCRILGGKLSIRSPSGKGTVVRVTFPVIEASGGA
jgi:PAS domain S-box-containing protein